ncbi:peroxin PEX13 Ecym_4710 [Eremothecium cymbalariae DBVPG|uniref:Peroxisomal membrane protein PEX13 n=1 Tax=Eremothecium cymbalariae (strain CBS 270.75 / DBVPG 7215 / KCTC 17166 / NRRL Y-17582) TaxID=931890 RepID=G8JSK8_ERECY|nr:hypothetical protein Ecym_4710 [Eremothecium cymbalariae DBVPG\
MSTSKPRPKPWEANSISFPNNSAGTIEDTNSLSMTGAASSGSKSSEYANIPDLPSKPVALNDESGFKNSTSPHMLNNSSYGGNMYGSGGMYGSSMYGGGYGSMYGGGFGSMYGGGYGGGMYGNGYGGGMYGMGGNVGNNGGIAESTQATFHLIENLIGAVTGFAQMLEATYMATHNSFLTMISVAEQFQYAKEMLGSFLGIFAIMKFLKRMLYRVTGGKMGIAPKKQLAGGVGDNKLLEEFEHFKSGKNGTNMVGVKKPKKMSLRPLLLFLAAVFGFPWLLNKFITKLQEMQNVRRIAGGPAQHQLQGIDLNNLEFARAVYDFTPENPRIECSLKKGDLMAIISKLDPTGNESQWWKVRTKKGEVGYIPSNYIELIRRQREIEPIPDAISPVSPTLPTA